MSSAYTRNLITSLENCFPVGPASDKKNSSITCHRPNFVLRLLR
jgi:hypothetical protein